MTPMNLPRLNDWQSRFAAVIATHTDRVFVRGINDCCTFAGACTQAITGRDPLSGFGVWITDREALRLLRDGGGMRAVVGRVLGAEIAVPMAQPGDVAMFFDGEQEALAVNAGGPWLGTGAHGLVAIDPAALLAAWRCTGEPEHG